MTNTSAAQACAICEQPEADARNLQQCFDCDRPFHLNPTQDPSGIDCGDAWIGASTGVEHYCQQCIDEMHREAAGALGGDAQLQQSKLMQMITPGAAPPAAAPSAPRGATDTAAPPPKPERPPRRRRYRRLDA